MTDLPKIPPMPLEQQLKMLKEMAKDCPTEEIRLNILKKIEELEEKQEQDGG